MNIGAFIRRVRSFKNIMPLDVNIGAFKSRLRFFKNIMPVYLLDSRFQWVSHPTAPKSAVLNPSTVAQLHETKIQHDALSVQW